MSRTHVTMSVAIRTLLIFRSDRRCAITIVIVSLVGCLPLLLFGIPAGHDGIAHASWQQQFVLEMKAGAVYPRWLSGAEQGTGSPVFFFYGPLAHYLGGLVSLLGCAGCSIEHRLGITIWLAIALSGISFFLSVRPFIDRPAAVAGSLYYMFLPYHFGIDVWTRAAFAETAAYVFFPWLLSAAWRVGRGWRPVGELAAALGLLLMTHLPSALLSFGALLGVSIVRVAYGPSALCAARTVAGVTLGCMLAAVYVLPALSLQDMASMDRLWSGGLRFDQNFLFGTKPSAFSRSSLKTVATATALVALFHACGIWWCNKARRELAAFAPPPCY